MALDPVDGVLQIGDDLIKHFFPDASEQAKAKEKLTELKDSGELEKMRIAANLNMAQISVNEAEAEKGGILSDWRDGLGWICVLAYAYRYIAMPATSYILSVLHIHTLPLPVVDETSMNTVLMGLLGLGGMKTVERVNNAKQ